jgi:hypothetical protein
LLVAGIALTAAYERAPAAQRYPPPPPPDLANFRARCLPVAQSVVPSATAKSCECLEQLFSTSLGADHWSWLTHGFDEERFLVSSVGRVDLYKKVSACLKRPQ